MSDLDILVPEAELWRAQRLLAEMGFHAPLPAGPTPPPRHLAMATLQTEGLSIHVEIHRQLLSDYLDDVIAYARSRMGPTSRPIAQARAFWRKHLLPSRLPSTEPADGAVAAALPDDLTVPPHPLALAGLTAWTLGHEDVLWHLSRHLTSHVNVWDFGRLIWVADIVSFAERFAPEIDWEQIRRQHPAVLDMLSLLHTMTPLSDELLNTANIRIGRAPQGIGVEYQGWPRTHGAGWRERGYRRVLRNTLCPSEWWLRLRYKLGSDRPLFWVRWVRHPLYIVGHVARVLLERMGWPTPFELAEGWTPT